MFLSALATLTSGVSESVGGAIKGWSDRSTIKAESKAKVEEIRTNSEVQIAVMEAEARKAKALVNVEKAKTGQQVDYEQDMEAIRQMRSSWKDEFLLLLFSIPLILSFIPDMQPYVMKGWEMLGQAPDWYLWLYGAMIVSVWGLRGIARSVFESKLFKANKS
tara:strand:+ start:808 stop:1293 length:486 start_codon:yes stop_codon:yes gene_type:complete